MENQYTYLYKSHDNKKYASEPDYDREADVDISEVKEYKELIQKFLDKGVSFSIAHKSGLVYLDIVSIDISSDKYVKFICKYVANTMTLEIPTFGIDLSRTGLVEETMGYDKLGALIQMNPDPNGKIMNDLYENYPGYYEFLENNNDKFEGVDLKFLTAPKIHG